MASESAEAGTACGDLRAKLAASEARVEQADRLRQADIDTLLEVGEILDLGRTPNGETIVGCAERARARAEKAEAAAGQMRRLVKVLLSYEGDDLVGAFAHFEDRFNSIDADHGTESHAKAMARVDLLEAVTEKARNCLRRRTATMRWVQIEPDDASDLAAAIADLDEAALAALDTALATDAGRGYQGPEQVAQACAAARVEALEEAAQVCVRLLGAATYTASTIRALKVTP